MNKKGTKSPYILIARVIITSKWHISTHMPPNVCTTIIWVYNLLLRIGATIATTFKKESWYCHLTVK